MVKTEEEEEEENEEEEEEEEEEERARSGWIKQKEEGWGNGRQHGKTNSEDGILSFWLLTFSIFLKFLVQPNFHFSVEMSNIRRYIRYNPVRTGILSGMNHGCFYTGSPTGTINSSRTGWYGTELTPLS